MNEMSAAQGLLVSTPALRHRVSPLHLHPYCPPLHPLLNCLFGSTNSSYDATPSAEVLELLPLLLQLPLGRRSAASGTFLEIGANDGMTGSTTLLLERCLGWRGLLIEGSTHTYEQLERAPRTAKRIHSAVCANASGGTVRFSKSDTSTVNLAFEQVSRDTVSMWADHWHVLNRSHFEEVPCAPLAKLMSDHGFDEIDFLSLDVQGAESVVLNTVDPRRFGMVLVESEANNRASNDKVDAVLRRADFKQLPLTIQRLGYKGYNRVYVSASRHVQDIRPAHPGEVYVHGLRAAKHGDYYLQNQTLQTSAAERRAWLTRALSNTSGCVV